MSKHEAERDKITVILPPEPPELNPEAARVLLRILLKAHESNSAPARQTRGAGKLVSRNLAFAVQAPDLRKTSGEQEQAHKAAECET
jgi:hypothetical protein